MRPRLARIFSIAAVLVVPAGVQAQEAAGEVAEEDLLAFNSYCRQCHVTDEGDHRLGPSLYKVMGREAGSQEGFNFSSAMGNADLVWDEETMDAFLENPDQALPGHNMRPFGGVPSAEERARIISYLKAESEE